MHGCVCNSFARMCIFIHGCVCNPFARMCIFIHGELCNPYARMCIFIHGWVYRGTVWEPPCSPDFFLASTCFSILALCGKIQCSLDFFLASTYFSILAPCGKILCSLDFFLAWVSSVAWVSSWPSAGYTLAGRVRHA